MINMTKAGETGGFLDQVLGRLADNFGQRSNCVRPSVGDDLSARRICFRLLSLVGMLLFIVPVLRVCSIASARCRCPRRSL